MATTHPTTETVETWRPITGYEGLYEVSDAGRVRSLDHVVAFEHPIGGVARHQRRGIVLTNNSRRTKKARVTLSREGAIRAHLVSHLVLEAFLGRPPWAARAAHANGDKTDCALSNLSWRPRGSAYAPRTTHLAADVQAQVATTGHALEAEEDREIWHAIPNYEGLYEASDQGRIRSIGREVAVDHPRSGAQTHHRYGVILVSRPDCRGRLYLSLSREGVTKTFGVARLILAAFGRPVPISWIVAHGDDDKSNCAFGNLSSRPRGSSRARLT